MKALIVFLLLTMPVMASTYGGSSWDCEGGDRDKPAASMTLDELKSVHLCYVIWAQRDTEMAEYFQHLIALRKHER